MQTLEAICRACHEKTPDAPTTPQDDLLLYEEWGEHFTAKKGTEKKGD